MGRSCHFCAPETFACAWSRSSGLCLNSCPAADCIAAHLQTLLDRNHTRYFESSTKSIQSTFGDVFSALQQYVLCRLTLSFAVLLLHFGIVRACRVQWWVQSNSEYAKHVQVKLLIGSFLSFCMSHRALSVINNLEIHLCRHLPRLPDGYVFSFMRRSR